MNCWDSINVMKQLGFYRSIILSLLFGLLSFILLYLPASLIHGDSVVRDHGVIPLAIGLALLPLIHKALHILPLKCFYKHLKIEWFIQRRIFPDFKVCENTKTSKPVLLAALIAPTIFITIPCITGGYMLEGYYPYFLLFASVNLSLSYIDFIYVRHLMRAPKKCVISNDGQGYDILIQR
ncbi:DUF3267 domain-containing protein [Gracilibacillus sp. YIM 98692]|uniref:DUF3267 domain-containing protein n=1 Tax=Gracilibacillus sp. YIM 98692 TaxID=2663532 RepID=UPI0013D52F0D|nr:DUF3267 domain-containing protein [Gracilibacillus sp. YIM 98692]